MAKFAKNKTRVEKLNQQPIGKTKKSQFPNAERNWFWKTKSLLRCGKTKSAQLLGFTDSMLRSQGKNINFFIVIVYAITNRLKGMLHFLANFTPKFVPHSLTL